MVAGPISADSAREKLGVGKTEGAMVAVLMIVMSLSTASCALPGAKEGEC